jgi:hypothetical protein
LIGIGPTTADEDASAATRSRLTERHVLALGLALSGLFVTAALATAAWSVLSGGHIWAALHLALAGAATVAIGTFMPHFAITLAGTRPSPAPQRLATLALLAVGSATVVLGGTLLGGRWAAAGAGLVGLGLAGVAMHTLAPLRDPLARRHPVVAVAYGTALAELAAGVALAGLAVAGVPAVISEWALVRPAHVWLTLFGGVSLTILATLVYLAPTVYGARIRPGRDLAIAVLGMGIGPIVVAGGFVLDSRTAVLAGMAITGAGAVAQLVYVFDCRRRRGPYTSSHDWRRVVTGHLVAGPFWFVAASVAALVELVLGRQLAGWSTGLLALPMVAGWMLQELVSSWTHLLPAVTPGSAEVHARQRRVLAIASRTRLVTWNGGLGLLWIGLATDASVIAVAGGISLGATVGLSVALLGRALAVRTPSPRASRPAN